MTSVIPADIISRYSVSGNLESLFDCTSSNCQHHDDILNYAENAGHRGLFKKLCQDPSIGEVGLGLFQYALLQGNQKRAMELIDNINLKAQNWEGRTALSLAAAGTYCIARDRLQL